MKVSRSGYYDWVTAGCTDKKEKDAVLLAKIRQAQRDNHGNLGVRRVYEEIREYHGVIVSKRRVQRIMHENGIKSRRCSKYKPQTTKADPRAEAFENLLMQDFTVQRRNQIWLADITYIRVAGRWAYMAIVLDLYDRMPIGWALGASPTAELAVMALRRAITRRKPGIGLIHHSDRGSQYTSKAYRGLLAKYMITGSMSRKGNPYDNAPMESFIKTLKVEWVNQHTYCNMNEAHSSLFYFLDIYYSCRRLHSSLGYKSPKNCDTQRLLAV